MTPRTALVSIGERLVDIGSSDRPIDVHRVGTLFRLLAKVYGHLVNDHERERLQSRRIRR